jgi:NitT/TauT family transport system substrate-binding protein
MKFTTKAFAVLAALAMAMSLAAGGGTKDSKTGSGLTKLTVGISPNLSTLGFFNAIDGGYFKKAGLEVKAVPLETGSQAVPLLLNGQFQFSFIDTPSVAFANVKGIGMKMVAAAQYMSDSGPSQDGIVVAADSPIKTPADLVGKTVAVSGVTSTSAISLRRTVAKAGGDDKKVQMVELPASSMTEAVKTGKIDAALYYEPFVTQGVGSGLRLLVHPSEYATPGLLTTSFAALDTYLKSHRDIADKFVDAVNDATKAVVDSINGDKSLVKTLLSKYTKVPPEAADSVVLPNFKPGPLDEAGIQVALDSLVDYGDLKEPMRASDLIWGGK